MNAYYWYCDYLKLVKTNVQLIYTHEISTGIQYLDPWTLALRISIEGSGNLIVKKTETIGWIFAGEYALLSLMGIISI